MGKRKPNGMFKDGDLAIGTVFTVADDDGQFMIALVARNEKELVRFLRSEHSCFGDDNWSEDMFAQLRVVQVKKKRVG